MSRVRSKSIGETIAWGIGAGSLVVFGMISLLSLRTDGGGVSFDFGWILKNLLTVFLWTLGTVIVTTLIALGLEFLERILGRHG